MRDKIEKNRQFAYQAARTFYRPDLLPELRSALAVEKKKEIVDDLKDL